MKRSGIGYLAWLFVLWGLVWREEMAHAQVQPQVVDAIASEQNVVDPVLQEELGLVRLVMKVNATSTTASFCSGTLLNNYWVITAAHCTEGYRPDQVELRTAWRTALSETATRIVSFAPERDIALVQLRARNSFIGSRTREGKLALPEYIDPGVNYVHEFGAGINQLATNTTQSVMDGQYRYTVATFDAFDPNNTNYELRGRNGTNIAGGDSGGPTFLIRWDDPNAVQPKKIYYLLGVHALASYHCADGHVCDDADPWTWADQIYYTEDASVLPVRDVIANWIRELPADIVSPSFPVGDGSNIETDHLYTLEPNGDLNFYRKQTDKNTYATTFDRITNLGAGYDQYVDVMGTGGLSIFAVTKLGELIWLSHSLVDGEQVLKSTARTVATYFGDYARTFAGGMGVVYGIAPNGMLYWNRYSAYKTGQNPETPMEPTIIGYGWDGFKTVFSAGRGVIYGVEPNGELMYYRLRDFLAGKFEWEVHALKVADGWDTFSQIIPRGEGDILVVASDGTLNLYRHPTWLDPQPSASLEGPFVVGTGWDQHTKVFGQTAGVPTKIW